MLRMVALTATLFVAACNTTTDTAEMAKPTVVDSLVGKTLVAGENTFIFNADGTVGGNIGENALVGSYSANETQVCSSYTAPERLVGLGGICSVPVITGDTVIFNRTNGTQSPVYTIQG